MRQRSLLFVTVACLIAADSPKEDVKKELESLKATWAFASFEANGQKAPDEVIKDFKLSVTGSDLTFKVGAEVKIVIKQLDGSTNPRIIDLEFKEGAQKGDVLEGIYHVEGDTLKICLHATPNINQRPTEFTGKENSNQILIVFKRVKP
jgi:uncharacterized protein (TIGR03067 family)